MAAVFSATLLMSCSAGAHHADPVSGNGKRPLDIGISYGSSLPSMDDATLSQALDDAAEIGATWIRLDLSWGMVQPSGPDAFTWDRFDHIFTEAAKRHLDVLPVLVDAPEWARTPGCSAAHCAPADPTQFAAFATAAAKRFGPNGIHTWEIWNEPNSALFWQPSVDPVAYTNLLRSASQAIHSIDSKAVVLIGGLSVDRTARGNLSVADFLAGAAQSPLRFADALAVHSYTFPFPPSRLGPWTSPWSQADSGLPYLRQLLAQYGAPNLPIWVTEYGAPTGGPGPMWDGAPDALTRAPDHVSETQQAIIAADGVATAAADPAIHAVFWYTDRDSSTGLDNNEAYFGMRRADGSKKPSFDALTRAVKGLSQ